MVVEELIALLGFDLKGEANLRRFQNGLKQAGSTLDSFGRVAAGFAGRLGLLAGGLGALGGAAGIGVLAAPLGMIGKAAIKTSAEFEALQIQLTTLEGSAEAGQKAFKWIQDFAAETPVSLQEAVKAYRDFKNVGLDPTNGSLLAAVDAMSAMGASGETLDRIIRGLGQAWSKQKFQAEEANQLIDAGLPAWQLMEEATGKNAKELMKLGEESKLTRREITLLIQTIGRRYKGASAEMSRSWKGMTARLSDEWDQFKAKIGEKGTFAFAKREFEGLMRVIEDLKKRGKLDEWAGNISSVLVGVGTTIGGTVLAIANVPTKLREARDSYNQTVESWDRATADAFTAGMKQIGPALESTFQGLRNILHTEGQRTEEWGQIGKNVMASMTTGFEAGKEGLLAKAREIVAQLKAIFENMRVVIPTPQLQQQVSPPQTPRQNSPAGRWGATPVAPASPADAIKPGASLPRASTFSGLSRPAGGNTYSPTVNVNVAGTNATPKQIADAGVDALKRLYFTSDSPATA